MAHGTIYNGTTGPLVLDDEGHVLGAGERRDNVELDGRTVEGRRIKGHIDAGRIVVIDVAEPAEPKAAKPRANDKRPTTEQEA